MVCRYFLLSKRDNPTNKYTTADQGKAEHRAEGQGDGKFFQVIERMQAVKQG